MSALTSSTRLTGCYIPMVVAGAEEENVEQRDFGDGTVRGPRSLRRVCLELSLFGTSKSGSAMVELGHTKVICRVEGPLSSLTSAGRGVECSVVLAPQFGKRPATVMATHVPSIDETQARVNQNNVAEEVHLASCLHQAIVPSIATTNLNMGIGIHVTVLQSDGNVLAASIVAASLALADANIELYNLVSACRVVVVAIPDRTSDLIVLADPTEQEELESKAQITLAVMGPSSQQQQQVVTYWDQTGRISPEMATKALELCQDGCATLHKFQRTCLVTTATK
jgi:exosome complex component MTR3